MDSSTAYDAETGTFPISANVRRKYDWAVRHMRYLDDEIGVFRNEDAYVALPDAHPYPLSDELIEITFTAKVHKSPPEHWGQILGDVASNLRAALDQAVIDLVARSGYSGPVDIRKRSFPIIATLDPDKFDREFIQARNQKIAGLSEEQIAVIKSVQPIKLEPEPVRWLETLSEIANIHKHRGFLDVGQIAMIKKVDLSFPLKVLEFSHPRVALKDGAYLGRVLLLAPPGKTELDLDIEGHSIETINGVTLPDDLPIGPLLQLLADHVYETLCRLEESNAVCEQAHADTCER